MNRTIMLSALVATMVMGIVGCGSDSTTVIPPSQVQPEDNPSPKKEKEPTREIKSEFTMPTTGLETVDYGTGLAISKDSEGNVYATYEHNDKDLGVRVLYYIDLDNSTATGSEAVLGADLMVSSLQSKEDGIWVLSKKILVPDDTNKSNKSKWKVDSSLDGKVLYNSGAKEDTIKIFPSVLTNGDYFSVIAELSTVNWYSFKTSDKIAFDIVLPTDGNVTFSGAGDGQMKITSIDDTIGIELSGIDYSANTEIFINTDHDSSTGYPTTDIWNNLGAEYRIAHNRLYHWLSDASTPDWDYNNSVSLPTVIKNDVVKMRLKKSDIGSPGNMVIGLAIFANGDSKPATAAIPDVNASFEIPLYEF